MKATLFLMAEMELGEGPVWCHKESKFYCVDIYGKQLHYTNEQGSYSGFYQLDNKVGFVVPTENGEFVCGFEDKLALFSPSSGTVKDISEVLIQEEGNRFNDGKTAPDGTVWCGTMNQDETTTHGYLYQYADNRLQQKLSGIGVSNGLDWSPDGKIFYYIDSPTRTVKAYDFDMHSGSISNPRVIIDVAADMGFPDGMTVDEEGMLWVAHWDGYCVRRWNPETGEVLEKIEVPAPRATSCCFGGEDMKTLFITTARTGLSEKLLNEYPLSGSVFSVNLKLGGNKVNYVTL